MSLEFKKGTYGYKLVFTITNADGTAYDLTGLTIKMYLKNKLTGAVKTLNGAAQGSATLGIVNVTIGNSDFDTVVDYDYELEFSSGGFLEKTPTFILPIRAPVN